MIGAVIDFLRGLRNPDLFHGRYQKPPYFEGWYFKNVSANENQRLAIIPGVFLGEDAHAFIQVLDGIQLSATYHRFPLDSFWASDVNFEISIGANQFNHDRIKLAIDDSKGQLSGELSYKGLTPWPVSWVSPGIMGWYAWVPRMECYHGVVSLDHTIEGKLVHNGRTIDFTGGRGYIEKDWGQAFPKAYVWMQSNHFGQNSISFTGSIAMIPWLGQSFRGFIVGLWLQDRLYRFATYTGARTTHLVIDDKNVEWHIEDHRHKLVIQAYRQSGGLILGPSRQDMLRRVEESIQAKTEIRLQDKRGNIVFEGKGRNTALEVHGDIKRLISPAR